MNHHIATFQNAVGCRATWCKVEMSIDDISLDKL